MPPLPLLLLLLCNRWGNQIRWDEDVGGANGDKSGAATSVDGKGVGGGSGGGGGGDGGVGGQGKKAKAAASLRHSDWRNEVNPVSD